MGVKKTGDWQKVRNITNVLKAMLKDAQKKCLMRWGLKAEGLAKGHISAQDLGWKPLKAKTVAVKIKAEHSENILVMTSSYFQAITSYVKGDTVYAGVKKGTKTSNMDLVFIAAVHEYGSVSRNIPARPLWKPVFNETMVWQAAKNSPADIFMTDFNARFGK